MIILAWNCRGLVKPSAVRSPRGFLNAHKPSVIFFSELKISSLPKVYPILNSLNFRRFHIEPAVCKAKGIALYWKANLDIRIIVSNLRLINCLIFNDPPSTFASYFRVWYAMLL